jgi:hypothetical protein
MKCPKCQTENKDGAKHCRKCSTAFTPVALWRPSWKWHATVLTVIYATLIVLFFVLNIVLKPYMRQIPKDITPWLKSVPQQQEKVG